MEKCHRVWRKGSRLDADRQIEYRRVTCCGELTLDPEKFLVTMDGVEIKLAIGSCMKRLGKGSVRMRKRECCRPSVESAIKLCLSCSVA